MTNTSHTLISVEPVEPSEPGALAGHEARCSCGFVARTSLSEREARNQLFAHVAYMSRRGRDVTDDPTSQIGDRTPTDWAGR